MDRPVLYSLVERLRAEERLQELASALPTRARVSEPVLPLVLAALHDELQRGLVVVLPEDADARDAAEAAGWFLGDENVALFPSRGVHWGSGLEPPPHLVGERARALAVLERGGLVCASATAVAEGVPPSGERAALVRVAPGDESGIDALAEQLASAGYERVERVEERGQFAVRGGLVDVFATTGREPFRIEFFGDEIEQIRAFSPFTQRALRAVEQATIFPAAERRRELVEIDLGPDDGEERALEAPDDLVQAFDRPPDFVWSLDEVQAVWSEEGLTPIALDRVTELTPLPQGQPHSFDAQRPALAARGLAEAENELGGLLRQELDVVVTFPHRGEALRQQSLLRRVQAGLLDPGQKPSGLQFAVSPARRGFVWRELGFALLPDTQVFRKRPPRASSSPGRALQSFSDLRTGDYVVHEDHGIAQLLGFETKEVAGVTRDYLLLAYRGDDRVYVPHEQIGKVSRYIGADSKAPALSKLGGKAWDNLKTRARAHLREMAGELLKLYAQRQTQPGIAYDVEHEWIEQLENEFPYRETEDQRTAIEAVNEDLESPHPMDRLVCGDVGFGKTEVALRAAFAVAVNGKQVLMLVPTTVLAQQHWNTFKDRYRDFPVRVEMVSRFRTRPEVKKALARLFRRKSRGADRNASRPLEGCDPEGTGARDRRRGAALRRRTEGVAAPVAPRGRRARDERHADPADTAHVALGLRDISVIETPPEGRRPIRTFVGEYDEALIKQALDREVQRKGQAFYLHNRVDTIEEAAAKLQQLCPDLRFLVAHGQMREHELEEQMISFLAGDADVLVSTTIIESGLDIPQANTLIVERADMLGLSQLYQIRGRVGRSDVLAHAYLFYPDAHELTPEARARLATLADHTELGAGFAIAMRDLEIRGAGDLLGAEQSGHVAALGFELYVEMLHEAVAELSGQRRLATRPVRVDARVDAFVPAAYVAAEALKIDLHRRIALTETEDDLHELRVATEDRYGPVPEPVENLFAIQAAKLKLARLGADYLVFRGGRASVGPVVLGSAELRDLRAQVETAVYSSGNREVTLRGDEFKGALDLVDAMLAARQAA